MWTRCGFVEACDLGDEDDGGGGETFPVLKIRHPRALLKKSPRSAAAGGAMEAEEVLPGSPPPAAGAPLGRR